jgi:hypothetical protein
VRPIDALFFLTPLLTNLNIDTGTIFQAKAVGSLVSRQRLPIEAKLEVLLAQALALGKDSKHDTKGTSVSKRKVSFLTRRLVTQKDGNGIVALGGFG